MNDVPTGFVGILSRNRPDTLLRCVTNVQSLAGGPLLVGIALDDDLVTYQNFPRILGVSRLLLQPRHYYVRGTNAVYRFLRQLADGAGLPFDYVVILNDDVEFQVFGWYPAAIAYLHERFPDGMGLVEFGVPDACANFITRAAFIDEHFGGEPANPVYTMYCSDSELLSRLKAMGRYASVQVDSGGAVLKHAQIQDALRAEMKPWYTLDQMQYNLRAKEFGWTPLA